MTKRKYGEFKRYEDADLLRVEAYSGTPWGKHRIRAEEIAKEHGVLIYDLLGRCTEHKVVEARRDLVRYLRETTKMSLPQIGRLVGRDHTTVLNLLTRSAVLKYQRAKIKAGPKPIKWNFKND